MPRAKKARVEIVRATPLPALPPDPAKSGALLDRLIEERVNEALARRDDALFGSHFQSKRVAYQIRRHQTVFAQRRLSLYFERWGCLACNRKRVPYGANGYCNRCRVRIHQRLKSIDREFAKEYAERTGQDPVEQIVSRVRSAELLLGRGEATK